MTATAARNGKHKAPDRWSDHKREKVSVVYFNLTVPVLRGERLLDNLRVKIGETGDHSKRKKAHEKSKHGVCFEVIDACVVRGCRADEQAVLKYFKRHHAPGDEEESFYPHDDLVDYIRWLRDQYFAWVPDDETCKQLEDIEVVESETWIPNKERRKAAPQVRNDLLATRFEERR